MWGFMSSFAKIFELMGDTMDFSQSKVVRQKNINLEKMWKIVNNSSFEADKEAFNSDYLKLKNDFDSSAMKVLYGKKT